MDTTHNMNKIAGWEIVIAFVLCFIAICIQHYTTSIWGYLLSVIVILIDAIWIMGMGKLKRRNHDRQNVSD